MAESAKKATEQNTVPSKIHNQAESEHPKAYAVVKNVTPAGLTHDAHQALVAASRLFLSEESAYHILKSVLEHNKHLPEDVRAHFEDVVSELEKKANVAETTRNLLEKYA